MNPKEVYVTGIAWTYPTGALFPENAEELRRKAKA